MSRPEQAQIQELICASKSPLEDTPIKALDLKAKVNLDADLSLSPIPRRPSKRKDQEESEIVTNTNGYTNRKTEITNGDGNAVETKASTNLKRPASEDLGGPGKRAKSAPRSSTDDHVILIEDDGAILID